jgi:hypothetical protein
MVAHEARPYLDRIAGRKLGDVVRVGNAGAGSVTMATKIEQQFAAMFIRMPG